MSANVRCAGNTPPVPQPGEAEVGLADAVYGPCGWTGERSSSAEPIEPMWLSGQRFWGFARTLNPSWAEAVTAKPCPRCGGQVELIGALAKPEPSQPAIVHEVEAAELPGAGGERP